MSVGPIEPRIAPPAAADSAATPGTIVPKAAQPADGPSPFAKLLRGLGENITSGESTMRTAVSAAHDLGPAQLISLQATVYRYSESIDLASRLVDHATSGLKTVLKGGGQRR